MKIVYNDWIKEGLDEFLLSQDGIKKVKINDEGYLTSIIVDLKNDLSPSTIASFIDLFQENKYSTMFSFDKNEKANTKKLTYKVEDICCEHCHMRFIGELFEDSRIIAADSNFKLGTPAFDIEYTITYLDTCDEKEIREFITNKLIEIGIIKK